MAETRRYWYCKACDTAFPSPCVGTFTGGGHTQEPVVVMPEAGAAALRRGPWVPVSERLPEPGREVLITVGPTENGPLATWGVANWDGHHRWWGFRGHHLGRTKDIPVLAWMPLPAPWDGEP